MKLFIDIVMKRIYLFNIVAWNYSKKIGFPVCKKENFSGLQAHRKRGQSARASPTPHHTLNEEQSARFTAQPLSALLTADLYSQVKFIDNLFRRHPLESSNYLFSFEFYFVATFTNVLVFIFPAHYSEKRFTGCPSEVNQLQKTCFSRFSWDESNLV